MKDTTISWQRCARKGWANKQSLKVGPFIIWVTKLDLRPPAVAYDVVIRTTTDVLLELKGLELTEIQARDLATNRAHALLRGYTEDLLSVSMTKPLDSGEEKT